MNATLLKALVMLALVGLLLLWSAISFTRSRQPWSGIRLAGATCLLVVVLTHLCEALGLFPVMRWGSPTSPGHYLDLSSALLGLTLLPAGYLGAYLSARRTALP